MPKFCSAVRVLAGPRDRVGVGWRLQLLSPRHLCALKNIFRNWPRCRADLKQAMFNCSFFYFHFQCLLPAASCSGRECLGLLGWRCWRHPRCTCCPCTWQIIAIKIPLLQQEAPPEGREIGGDVKCSKMLASNPEDFAIKTLVYCQKNWYLMCCSFGINSQSKQHIVSPVKNLQNQCFPFSSLIGHLFPFSARCLSILLSWASRFALLRSSWIKFKSYY